MEAHEYFKLATDKTEAGDLIKENNLTEAVIKLMSNYAEFRVKNSYIPAVVGLSEQYFCQECGKQIYAAETDICLACLEKGCGL